MHLFYSQEAILILQDAKVMYNACMDYSRFQAVYANIPEKLRKEIVAVVNEEPYSWNAAHVEIANETELGKEILAKLIEMDIV